MRIFAAFTTQLRYHLRPRLACEAGLTLIEVVVTTLMVGLIAAGTATALIATSNASGQEQLRSEADALAAQDLDQLRSLSDEQLNGLQDGAAPRSHQQAFQGTTFTVSSSASFTSAGASVTGCTTGAAAFYKIASTVSWRQGTSTQSLEEDSLLTRPVTGGLLVQVSDPSNNPLSGVAVVANGASWQTAQTNSAGCTQFAGLTSGSYTVTLSKSGYVDINGNATPSYNPVAVGSSGGQLTGLQLGAASGPISATFKAATGGTGEAGGLSWSATGMTAPGANPLATANPTTTGTTASSGSQSLYPTSYAVWGGRCPNQEPPTGKVASANVSAGQGASATVTEPALAVTSVTDKYTSGRTTVGPTAVKPNDVVFTFTDGTCTDIWPATIASATTMPSTGWLANPGQPYAPAGDLSACADYYNPTTRGYFHGSVAVTGGNTSFTGPNSVSTIPITEGTTTSGKCPTS
jgi:Tfp pilus assembly protein PilV